MPFFPLGLTTGGPYQPLDSDLTAIAALSGTGIAVRTSANTWAQRSLVAPASGITIANPAGVASDPTFALADDLAALEALATTGYARRTGANAWTLDSAIPAGSVTAPGSNTQVIINSSGVMGAASTLTYASSVLTQTRAGIAVTPTDGIVLTNPTASTGVVSAQYSPSLRFLGSGWNSDAVVSQSVEFRAYVQTNPGDPASGSFVLESSVAGGAWSFPLEYRATDGTLVVENIQANGTITGDAISGPNGTIDLADVSANLIINSSLGFIVNGPDDFVLNPQDGAGPGIVTINGSLALTTVLDEIYGGTGLTSYAQGDLLYGSATNVLSKLAKNTSATRYLSNTGTSNNPAWAQINLANGVTGTLPAANGGTGQTTYAEGDILYANAGGTLSKRSIPVLPGYVLGPSGGVPDWVLLSTLAVTSLAGTAGEITFSSATGSVVGSLPTALTFSGKTVTGGTFASPTLTTPSLGTPASGVVTNLTGTASININGTVGATTPSTGVFTTLAASGLATFSAVNPSIVVGAGNGSAGGIRINPWTATNRNWQIDSGITGSDLQIAPSTVVGGNTFTTPALTLTASGINATAIGATTPSTVGATAMSQTAGSTFSIASGSNQRAGNLTLVAGTQTVSNTTVTANTIVQLTRKTSGGTIGTAITYTLSAGTSFTVTSDSILDTSTFSYLLIEVP